MKRLKALAISSILLYLSLQSYAEDIEIGAILLDTKGEWMSEVMHGMKQAGKDLDVKVKISDSNSDLAKEASIIDNYIAQQMSAIALMPQSDQASIASFNRIAAAKIPTVTFNSRVNSEESKYFVGVNNYDLGKQTGSTAIAYIQENMDGKAKIAIIGTSKYSVGQDRVRGFIEEVEKLPGVKIVARQDAEFQAEGMATTEAILLANSDIDMVWAWNLTSMLGAYAAIKTQNLDNVILMGTDMSIDIARFMLEEDTFLKAVTTQQPFELGYQSIKTASELAEGKNVQGELLVPLITYSSTDKEALQEYINSRDYLN